MEIIDSIFPGVWSKRSIRGMTAMGIRFLEGPSCTGILLPVSNDELLKFDEREAGYNRVAVPTKNIDIVPFLGDGYYEELDKTLNNLFGRDDVKIWIYEPQKFCLPTPDAPIAQTYVDTILRGCLSISEEFAINFLTTTRGWSTVDLAEEHNDNLRKGDVWWTDDRIRPIYLRGDNAYSSKYAKRLDTLLQTHRPKEYPHRVHISAILGA